MINRLVYGITIISKTFLHAMVFRFVELLTSYSISFPMLIILNMVVITFTRVQGCAQIIMTYNTIGYRIDSD